ncbi:aKG-HExxH-type peptide beta-hydroxylase [Microbacterium laevaniformans]|uniref:aKG-HExxH-type peptide beta-hydroxylase n=1 Tax=Microbacterium laevaniformans TaxID=36807 RepID=UPI00363B0905
MEVQEQLRTPQVDVRATAQLAQAYARSLGVHAARALGTESNPSLKWISPRGVWLSLAVAPERKLSEAEESELEALLTEGAGRPAPTRIVTAEQSTPWDHESAAIISRTTNGGVDESHLAVAPDPDGEYRSTLNAAFDVFRKAWPEGAVEFSTLIRSVIVLRDTELTASHDQLFGTVFSGAAYITSVPLAYELLLHECGHHSMFLRVWRNDLVENPGTLVSHPLRHDPRPISGTLHAAYSLWRMWYGMSRWCDRPDLNPPPEAFEIRDRDFQRLHQTLETLRDNAVWTPEGKRLFDNLSAGVLT